MGRVMRGKEETLLKKGFPPSPAPPSFFLKLLFMGLSFFIKENMPIRNQRRLKKIKHCPKNSQKNFSHHKKTFLRQFSPYRTKNPRTSQGRAGIFSGPSIEPIIKSLGRMGGVRGGNSLPDTFSILPHFHRCQPQCRSRRHLRLHRGGQGGRPWWRDRRSGLHPRRGG